MPVSKNRRKKPKPEKKPKQRLVAPPEPEPIANEPTIVPPTEPVPGHAASSSPAEIAAAPAPAIQEPGPSSSIGAPPLPETPPRRISLNVISNQQPPAEEEVHEAVSELRQLADEPPLVADPFGRDPAFERRALRALRVLYRRYFRVETRGIENVPATGAAILVANHSGALPWDGIILKCALAYDHPNQRSLRPLAENVIFHFPFLGVLFNRFGAVRACQENAEALLEAGEAVAVFPEGVKGLGKLFRQRYQLQRFGRGGFVKLAMRTRTPIIPVAIVGAEETHPLLARIVRPVEPLGLPYVPVTPTFPLLGPLGLLPLPTKWTIEFGAPITVDEAQMNDELVIERLTEDVRSDIQGRIDALLSKRKSWFA